MGRGNLWMSFLVVVSLDNSDQSILGREVVRNFDMMIDLNNGLIRIRNPDRKYVRRPVNRMITDENKIGKFLDRQVKLQPRQAVVAILRMRIFYTQQVIVKQFRLVPRPNSQWGRIIRKRRTWRSIEWRNIHLMQLMIRFQKWLMKSSLFKNFRWDLNRWRLIDLLKFSGTPLVKWIRV